MLAAVAVAEIKLEACVINEAVEPTPPRAMKLWAEFQTVTVVPTAPVAIDLVTGATEKATADKEVVPV